MGPAHQAACASNIKELLFTTNMGVQRAKPPEALGFFEPTCANARWAHMHRFASVMKITGH